MRDATAVRLLQAAASDWKRRGYRVSRYEDGILTLVRRHHMNPIVFVPTLPFAFMFAPPRDRWVFLTVIGGQVITQEA
jgi:hypothetical protein